MGKILIKNGRVMPGLPGFKYRGDAKTTCAICGKPLSDELSYARGIGPECIKEYGPLDGRGWIEGYAKPFKSHMRRQKKLNQPPMTFNDWLKENTDEVP